MSADEQERAIHEILAANRAFLKHYDASEKSSKFDGLYKWGLPLLAFIGSVATFYFTTRQGMESLAEELRRNGREFTAHVARMEVEFARRDALGEDRRKDINSNQQRISGIEARVEYLRAR